MSEKSGYEGKQEWLVILPDKPNMLSKRLEVRQEHLTAVQPLVKEGFLTFGGASLDEPLKEGEGPKINGSALLAKGDSKESVLERLKEDVYFRSGVWDWDRVTVMPFKRAI